MSIRRKVRENAGNIALIVLGIGAISLPVADHFLYSRDPQNYFQQEAIVKKSHSEEVIGGIGAEGISAIPSTGNTPIIDSRYKVVFEASKRFTVEGREVYEKFREGETVILTYRKGLFGDSFVEAVSKR